MVNAVYDNLMAIIIVGAIFVGAVVVLPSMSFTNLQAVDQQQLRSTALNVFNGMLLGTGEPSNWGSMLDFQMNDPRIQRFGMASAEDSTFYVLNPDKVQRLVIGNPLNYCDYPRVRELLGLQDYGFRFRIIPPFNITFQNVNVTGSTLNYKAKVAYLDGSPIPNAEANATVVYSKGKDYFNVTQSGPTVTNAMGTLNADVPLDTNDPDFYMVALRVTVADVATLVTTSGQDFENKIANINLVYDDIILTSWKEPPDYNEPPSETCWIMDIVAMMSDGTLWTLLEGEKSDQDNKFNSGTGPYERWSKTFYGLHGLQPVVLIFNFWAVDPVTGQGRQQVLITIAYPDLLGLSIFEFGATPKTPTARIQRNVIISGMTYTAEFWLWRES